MNPASLLRGFEEALLAAVPEPSYLLMPTMATRWADDDHDHDHDEDDCHRHKDDILILP